MSICLHNKLKTRCFPCGGGSMCQHGRRNDECRNCHHNAIHLLILKLIRHSRYADKAKNHYDENNFIDYEFVNFIIQQSYDLCFYCGKELQYIDNEHNLATIERLDNSIGHTKDNCVIACRTCNLGHVGSRLDLNL